MKLALNIFPQQLYTVRRLIFYFRNQKSSKLGTLSKKPPVLFIQDSKFKKVINLDRKSFENLRSATKFSLWLAFLARWRAGVDNFFIQYVMETFKMP